MGLGCGGINDCIMFARSPDRLKAVPASTVAVRDALLNDPNAPLPPDAVT
jgi:hypothetical protein